ncbi:MAG: hypothetical protein ABR532_07855 [Candidatus Dormibacteria bacterium]
MRFFQTPGYLFVETSYFVLPPLKGSYYDINTFNPRPTGHELVRLALDSTTRTPLLWLEAPLRVAKWIARPLSLARREQRIGQSIRENRRFDYGALGSIRESGSENAYAKYFQHMDMERLHKIVDRHLLTSIRKFLDEKGMDTRELEQSIRFMINRQMLASGDRTGNKVGEDALPKTTKRSMRSAS